MIHWAWQIRLALLPLFVKPRRYVAYWLILASIAFSLFLFQNLHSQLKLANDQSFAALLGGDIKIDTGYRPIETSALDYLRQDNRIWTEEIRFRSMITQDRADLPRARLALIHAVDEHYPLYERQEGQFSLYEQTDAQDGIYGIKFSPGLTDYFDLEIGDIIKVMDQDFEYRGLIANEFEFNFNSDMFYPAAYISRAALNQIGNSNNTMLFRHNYYGRLANGQSASSFQDQLQRAYHAEGWLFTTRDDYKGAQNSLIGVALNLASLVNILVLIGFTIALYIVYKIHLREERATIEWLHTLGAKRGQILFMYALRLFAILVLSMMLCGLFLWLADISVRRHLDDLTSLPELGTKHWRANAVFTLVITTLLSLWVCVVGYVLSVQKPSARVVIFAAGLFLIIVYLLGRVYVFQAISVSVLIGFFVALLLYWNWLRFVKRALRRLVRPKRLGQFAILEFAYPRSEEENFGTVLFALVLIAACVFGTIFGLQDFRDQFATQERPTHFIADIQSEQVDELERALKKQGAQGLERYAIVRARVVALNGQPSFDRDHWLFRGDRIFSVDKDDRFNLERNKDGSFEIAMDREIAKDLGLELGDQMTISVLGTDYELKIKTLRQTQMSINDLDFIFLMPPDALSAMPKIYLEALSLDNDTSNAFDQVISQFPNVIIVSTSASISRFSEWIDRAIGSLLIIGIHIGIAFFVALIAIAVLIMRKERYNINILNLMGMSKTGIFRLSVNKILLHAINATLACFLIFWLFNTFAMARLFDLDIELRLWEIALIAFIVGVFSAALPSFMMLFNREKAANAEEYTQDFNQLALDF